MGRIHWYKRDPVAWLHGTRKLTLEERGAYADVIELIMSHDGRIADDDEDIAGWLRCHLRKWRSIKARLIEAGKLHVRDGHLHNFRCDKEATYALKFIESCSKGGEKSGEKRRAKREESKACVEGQFTETDEVTTTTPTPIKEEGKKEPPSEVRKKDDAPPKGVADKPASPRGSRIPADWKPSAADVEFARAHGMDERSIASAADEFRTYWASLPGQRATKISWSMTWQNNVLKRHGCSNVSRPQLQQPQKRSRAQDVKELYDEWFNGNASSQENHGSSPMLSLIRGSRQG